MILILESAQALGLSGVQRRPPPSPHHAPALCLRAGGLKEEAVASAPPAHAREGFVSTASTTTDAPTAAAAGAHSGSNST